MAAAAMERAGTGAGAGARDIGELNRKWFDSHASTAYQADWVRDLMHQISSFLDAHVEWLAPNRGRQGESAIEGKGLRLLDYACGGGIVSATLAPYASHIRGIDISSGMTDLYNASAQQLGFSADKMHAVRGDLLFSPSSDPTDTPPLEHADFHAFDLIVMSMALHHVSAPALMIANLAQRLAPGGSLVIIDWVAHGLAHNAHKDKAQKDTAATKPHPAAHTVTRHGFEEAEMREMYEKAGLEGFEQRLHEERSWMPTGEGELQLFFARASRRR